MVKSYYNTLVALHEVPKILCISLLFTIMFKLIMEFSNFNQDNLSAITAGVAKGSSHADTVKI